MTFDYDGALKAADDLNSGAGKIEGLISDLEEEMTSIFNNYKSDSATEIMEKLKSVKEKGPDFVKAVQDCAKYLKDEVAPSYLKVEQTAAEKVGA